MLLFTRLPRHALSGMYVIVIVITKCAKHEIFASLKITWLNSINTTNANCPELNVSTVEAVWIVWMALLAPVRAVGMLFLKTH